MSKRWTLLGLFLTGAAGVAHAQIPPGERQVLLDLYKSTGGEQWTDNSGWSDPEEGLECSWYGVVCGDNELQKIVLDHNNLRGALPGNLNTLTRLRGLSANGNELTGKLPSLAGLRHLQFVFLQDNRLSGELPPLSELAALTSLDISSNELTGSIPNLGALQHLQFLNLSGNRLTGPIPPLDRLTELKMLNLAGNKLSGEIPALAGLPLLHDCFLSDNELSGPIPELRALPELRYFRAGSNRLTGTIPDLGQLPNLVELELKNNNLSGRLPPPPPRLSSASLCPNALTHPSPDPTTDRRWNQATKEKPWWSDCKTGP